MSHIGICHYALNNYSEALKFFTRCLDMQENLFGPGVKVVEITRMRKGQTIWQFRKVNETIAYIKPAVEVLKKVDGMNLDLLSVPLTCLGNALLLARDLDGAQRYLTEAIVIIEKHQGRINTDMASAVLVLGKVLLDKKRFKSASEKFAQLIEINTRCLAGQATKSSWKSSASIMKLFWCPGTIQSL